MDYIRPMYSIRQYTDTFYKVVGFNNSGSSFHLSSDKDDTQHYEEKLSQAYSRARSKVLDYALCNPWQYFFTGTIDQTKFNRFSLDTFYLSFSQWLRDERKRLDSNIQFLIVPEQHKKGGWHIHGLIFGLPSSEVSEFPPEAPYKLKLRGYKNWQRYQEKFGFCSLGAIRDPVAVAFYLSKYISKDFNARGSDVGQHLYYHSRGLKSSSVVSDVYSYDSTLEHISSENQYQFCRFGYAVSDDWTFPHTFDTDSLSSLSDLFACVVPEPAKDESELFEQSTIDDFIFSILPT